MSMSQFKSKLYLQVSFSKDMWHSKSLILKISFFDIPFENKYVIIPGGVCCTYRAWRCPQNALVFPSSDTRSGANCLLSCRKGALFLTTPWRPPLDFCPGQKYKTSCPKHSPWVLRRHLMTNYNLFFLPLDL